MIPRITRSSSPPSEPLLNQDPIAPNPSLHLPGPTDVAMVAPTPVRPAACALKDSRSLRLMPSAFSAQQCLKPAPEKNLLRFNELINALQALPQTPDDVVQAIEHVVASGQPNDASALAFCVQRYSDTHHHITRYALGEALAELVQHGVFGPSMQTTQRGEISAAAMAKTRQKDRALDALMHHLLDDGGIAVRRANSPLSGIKQAHSSQYMALCVRSSRSPLMDAPATRKVIDELKAQQVFANMYIFQAQHGFDSNEIQSRGLFEMGLQPQRLFYFPKTGSRTMVLERMMRMGVNMYDAPYDLRHVRNAVIEPLKTCIDQAFNFQNLTLAEQLKTLRTRVQQGPQKPVLLFVDEGFKVGQALLTLQSDADPLVAEKYALIAQLCPMVAHTEGDIIKGKKQLHQAQIQAQSMGRSMPFLPRTINMAQSRAKGLEGFAIGEDVYMSAQHLFSELGHPQAMARRPKEVLNIGYGVIASKGKPWLKSGHDVWVWDISPQALLRAHDDQAAGSPKLHIPVDRTLLEQVMQRGGRADDPLFLQALSQAKAQWFSHGHIVVGNTGAPQGCLQGTDFDLLPDGALLVSGSSGNYEFGDPVARTNNPHLRRIQPGRDNPLMFPLACDNQAYPVRIRSGGQAYFHHQVYETAQQKKVMLLRGGYVVNRLWGTPSAFIDITTAIMLRSMHQAVMPHSDVRPPSGLFLVDLDAQGQEQAINIVNAHLQHHGWGSIEEPDFSNIDPHWHRPAVTVPDTYAMDKMVANNRYTSERFVQSGLNACARYKLSALSFALVCAPAVNLVASENVRFLEQALQAQHQADKLHAHQTPIPERNLAHTLYAIVAHDVQAPPPDQTVDTLRRAVGLIDDAQWQHMLQTHDAYGMLPADYAVLANHGLRGGARFTRSARLLDTQERARVSMQRCLRSISINAPSQAQLKADETLWQQRRAHIMRVLSGASSEMA